MGENDEKLEEAGEELTDDEKVIVEDDTDDGTDDLDEGDESKKQPDGDEKDKGEPDADTVKVDDEKHKPADDNMIPQTEFNKRVGEIRTQAEQKLDFLRRDPEGYYQKYPQERPAQQTTRPAATDTMDTQVENLVVRGGHYEGMTLKDVMQVDQVAANRMMFDYFQGQRDEIQAAETRKSQRLTGAQKEVDAFQLEVSKEFYGKTDGLTEEETKKVNTVIQSTLNWMRDTGRGFANLTDSYYLMTRDQQITKAKGDGARAIADSVNRGNVATISSNKGGGNDTGYEADLTMTAAQLESKLDKMSDKAMEKWAKNAPDGLKKKYSDMPWW